MRKVLIGVVCLCVIAGSLPAFAGGRGGDKEENLFKIIMDSFSTFEVREQDKLRGTKKVGTFQAASDMINGGSDKARNQSLRD